MPTSSHIFVLVLTFAIVQFSTLRTTNAKDKFYQLKNIARDVHLSFEYDGDVKDFVMGKDKEVRPIGMQTSTSFA